MDRITITWVPEDIMDVSEMTRDQAEEWLSRNGKHLQDRSIELGWQVIGHLLEWDNGTERT